MERNNNLNVDELNAVSGGMNDTVPDSPDDAPQPLPPCPICGSHRIENALFDENGVTQYPAEMQEMRNLLWAEGTP